MHRFRQVDVFGSEQLRGNPVAVVHDADDLDTAQMQLFAQWTHLSETTFLLAPTDAGADYRVRIFTPDVELPFAGHPTLGTAHAWLEAGGRPASRPGGDVVVQECTAGLVSVRRGERLSFAAPPLVRSGPVDAGDLAVLIDILGVAPDRVLDAQWVDNGPGWVGLLLADARDVLDLRPDRTKFDGHDIGVIGAWGDDSPGAPGDADVEVRAFMSQGDEDPVTGSLNASLGQWLAGDRLPAAYVASQGTVIGRRGRVHVSRDDSGAVWVAGDTVTVLSGEAHLTVDPSR